jgi:hypothetical protein
LAIRKINFKLKTNIKMENKNSNETETANDANTMLGECFNPHQTIPVGWKNGKIIYCRTFDDENYRESMLKGFDCVREVADSYIMTSQLDKTIAQED